MALMTRRVVFHAVVTLAVISGAAAQAAAAPVTYVSVRGRDRAPCTALRPCRTFAAAVAATDPGGMVVALDSGVFSFSHLNLTQSITIAAAPGVHAILRPSSFAAVSVNADASAVVTLRGLTLLAPAGATPPFNGIVYNSAAALYVEGCSISGFPTKGMIVLSAGRLVVRDTTVSGGVVGISLDGHVRAALERVRLGESDFGLMSSLGATASIRDSLVSGNGVGLLADAAFDGESAELSIESCLITHNDTGVEVRPHATTARLSRSTVTNNGTGLLVSGGVLETRGNNTVRGNGSDVSGPLTPIAGD